MQKLSMFAAPAAAAVVCAGLFSLGCSHTVDARSVPETAIQEPSPPPGSFAVAHPEQFPTVAAQVRRVHDDLLVNGVVAPDVSLTVPVTSMSAGRVLEIQARLGDDVAKGQVLLRLHSPDLAGAIADYQKAVADETLARRALDRAQTLYDHGATAQKDLETAKDVEEKAQVDVRNGSERIRILGGVMDSLSPVLEVRAPVSGTIVEQNVTGGAGVKSLDNSPNLFTIADLSRVWILCDVYEDNLAQVHVGDYAQVRLNAYPNRVLRGRVSNIGKILDPNTRTAKVRLELANSGGLMRPGMFATASFVSQDASTRVVVPASAVLRLHDRDWVFQPLEGKLFRRVEVKAGPTSRDGSQELLSGLRPGDRIVATALQFSSTVENQ